jgi:amino acid adenylation domain-containing protein
MEHQHLAGLITGQARRNPGKAAIKYNGQSVSYLELETKSNQVANYLYKRVNGNPYVNILLDSSPELIAAVVGLLKCSLVFVPIDPIYPAGRIKKYLIETGAQWLITSSQYYEKFQDIIKPLGLKVLFVDEEKGQLVQQPVDLTFERIYNKYAYILFTSGSVGIPRGVLGRHKSILHFIQWEINEIGANEHFNVCQLSSPSFDPFLRDVFVPLVSGGTTCLLDKKEILMDPRQLVQWLDRNEITLIHIVPSLFKLLVNEITDANCLKNLEVILLAGELLRGNDIRKFLDLFKDRVRLYNCYGPTETTQSKLVYKITREDVHKTIIPVGKPIQGAQAMVLDENMKPCLTGNVGEIYIRTPYASAGYFNDRALNRKVFIKNPFSHKDQDYIYKTGDLGRLLFDGKFEVVGRVDHQVKIRGFRVELGEIESQLLKHEAVKDAVVIGKDDENGDKDLCAYIVGVDKTCPVPNPTELRQYLSKTLPDYMIPSYFVAVDEIPLTSNGKIHRDALPEPGTSSGHQYTAPANDTQRKLVEIWAEELNIDQDSRPIGIDDNFFDLGGHSIKAIAIISGIYKKFHVKVPIMRLFDTPTIRALSHYITGAEADSFASIREVEKKYYYVLSSAQQRLYILHQLGKQGTGFNITTVIILEGRLDKERLENTFKQLIRRHDTFRTSFQVNEMEPVQRIHPAVQFELQYYDLSGNGRLAHEEDILKAFRQPFDLTKAPLLRVGLIKKANRQYILMVDTHHIIIDGTSQALLMDEFAALYSGRDLIPLKLQYKDYAEWQNSKEVKEAHQEQKIFWLEQFKGDIPRLNLPCDYQRPPVKNYSGERITLTTDSHTAGKLQWVEKETETTLFMILLAVFTVLLSKHTRKEDIVVGSPITGRRHPDLNNVIGMFVNMLAIKTQPQSGKTFREFLLEVKQQVLKAMENQDYQFEQLVVDLGLQGEVARNPLFDVVLYMQNFGMGKDDLNETNSPAASQHQGDLKIVPYGFDPKLSRFDLLIVARKVKGAINLVLEYAVELFKKNTAREFLKHFEEILNMVANNIDIQLKEIKIYHGLTAAASQILQQEQGDFQL